MSTVLNKKIRLIAYRILCILFSIAIFIAPGVSWAGSTLTDNVPVDAERASLARSRPFTLIYKDRKWTASAAQVKLWFKTKGPDGNTALQLRPAAIYSYLNINISPKFNDLGQVSRFVRSGNAVVLTGAGRKGQIINGVKTSLAIRNAILAGKDSAKIVPQEYRPAIFSVEDFKKLSFPSLLTHVETNFSGSPANRIKNIQVGASRFNGLVILPGETFSFNQYLGAVDKENGYEPELVIKEHVTTPEYGGGICQVSTTAFRAALYGGFKITERHNHSYPVAYYGAPGADATVYPPRTDLKFINDTAGPIHLLTRVEGTKVIFEIWGKSDGRQVTINGPFTTARKPDGSLKAAIAQIVKKGSQIIREQNFESSYQSPDKFPTIRQANRG